MATTKPSSRAQIVAFAILMPATVAATNHLLLEAHRTNPRLSPWLYPWLVCSTAALSWSAGRYLRPPLIGWIVFGWTLVLLDLITIAACLSGAVAQQQGYVLVSSEITLLVVWAILAAVPWQWRLPAVLVALAAVILSSGSFMRDWHVTNWHVLMIITSAVLTTVCIALRLLGFRIRAETSPTDRDFPLRASPSQFSTMHILAWGTAIVPLLLIARGINLLPLKSLAHGTSISAALLAASLATIDLFVIGAVLGRGERVWILVPLVCITPLLAYGFDTYSEFCFVNYRARGWVRSTPPFEMFFIAMRNHWSVWFYLDTAILAALLLFLRGQGYQLERNSQSH
jgi:hypothetical protein